MRDTLNAAVQHALKVRGTVMLEADRGRWKVARIPSRSSRPCSSSVSASSPTAPWNARSSSPAMPAGRRRPPTLRTPSTWRSPSPGSKAAPRSSRVHRRRPAVHRVAGRHAPV